MLDQETRKGNGASSRWLHSTVKRLTATGLAAVGRGYLLDVTYVGAAAADSAQIYDSTITAGEIIDQAVQSAAFSEPHPFPIPRPFAKGLYVVFGATEAAVILHFILERDLARE
jgi:hypothetical protein